VAKKASRTLGACGRKAAGRRAAWTSRERRRQGHQPNRASRAKVQERRRHDAPSTKSRQRKPPGSASGPPTKTPPGIAHRAAGGPAAGGIEHRQPWLSDKGCGTRFAKGVVRGEGFHSTTALLAEAEERSAEPQCKSSRAFGASLHPFVARAVMISKEHPATGRNPDRTTLPTGEISTTKRRRAGSSMHNKPPNGVSNNSATAPFRTSHQEPRAREGHP